MKIQWEYKIEKSYTKDITEMMQSNGRDGWEAWWVTPDGNLICVYFKRQIRSVE